MALGKKFSDTAGFDQRTREIAARVAASGYPVHRDDWTVLVDKKLSKQRKAALQILRLRYQSEFEAGSVSPDRKETLRQLRGWMKEEGVDFIVLQVGTPQFPEGEPPRYKRLKYLTGFSGSYATAIIGLDRALFATTPIYEITAKEVLPPGDYEIMIANSKNNFSTDIMKWLKSAMKPGDFVAYDPHSCGKTFADKLNDTAQAAKAHCYLLDHAVNPIYLLWPKQPPEPLSPVTPYPVSFSGVRHQDKIKNIVSLLEQRNIDTLVLTAPESIAWLYNIRGFDSPCVPLPVSYALIHASGASELFLDKDAVAPGVKLFKKDEKIRIRPVDEFQSRLASLGLREFSYFIAYDPETTSAAISRAIQEREPEAIEMRDPCLAMKAIKNDVEQASICNAHAIEGLAYCRFLWQIEMEWRKTGKMDEYRAADILEQERRKEPTYMGPSFPTISSIGKNGAEMHYRPTARNSAAFVPDTLYLVDAGAQYTQGTTDMTRVIPTGNNLSDDMRRAYTAVLKSHIALARANFAPGTPASDLDKIARDVVKEYTKDETGFAHSTGHGVGQAGRVHEMPPLVGRSSNTIIERGMFFSNEPGVYKQGEFGIRIENLFFAQGDDKKLSLEPVSLAPIDLRPAILSELSAEDIAWLDSYHHMVYKTLAPSIKPDDIMFALWLIEKTQPVAELMEPVQRKLIGPKAPEPG